MKVSNTIIKAVSAKKYAAKIAAVRQQGGDNIQSHLEARVAIAKKRQSQRGRKPTTR
jgi:hypothetical protein